MRISLALLFAVVLQLSAENGYAQRTHVAISMNNVSVEQVLNKIEEASDYVFLYNDKTIQKNRIVSVRNKSGKILDILDDIFKGTDITYTVVDKQIILSTNKMQLVQQEGQIQIKGVVKDAGGDPLIGVNVKVKDSTVGTITDINGNFTLQTRKGDILEISYVGYATKTVKVQNAQVLNIVLTEDTEVLNEVVVTALGIKKEAKSLSYNVQQVSNAEITRIADANFVNNLNGKVAGVTINSSSAGVGGSSRVVMRGTKSLNGNNNALYVVDGIPMSDMSAASTQPTDSYEGAGQSGDPISGLNPEDIESISVLSGPSAAALYGSAAANGVVMITTKKGREGRTSVSISNNTTFSAPLVLPEFQNTYGQTEVGSYYSWGSKLNTPSSYDPKDFFELGATFNNSFNLSTGNDKNQTYFSIAAVNSDGIVPNNKYHRYNVTLRNTAKFLNDKLTLDASASYIREYYNNMISYGTYFNPIVGAYLYPRGEDFEKEKYFERYNSELGYSQQQWSPGDFGMDIQNPYWIAYRNIRPEVKDRYMLYASLKYDITNYLNVAGRVRLDNTYTEKEDKRYASTINTYASTNGRYTYSNETFRQKYADIMVNFDKQFAEIYHATINAGTSFEEYDTKGRGYGGQLLLVPNKFVYSNIDTTQSTASQTGGDSRRRNFAVFASAEVSWNSALYLTLTGRADKPSQLVNSDDPWIFYPSVGLSAIVTELLPNNIKEKLEPTLGFLKVRASYTEVGSPIPYTGLTPGTLTHELEGGTFKPFKYYPISNLKAERTRSYEVGLDSKWFNNTITFGVTYYHSNTYNQLLKATLGSNFEYMFVQAGNVQNRGLELSLGFDKKFGNFNYSTTFTATTNKNKIIQLARDVLNPVTNTLIDLTDIQVGRFRLREGGEIGTVYANEWLKRDGDNYVDYQPGQALTTETTTPYKLGSVNPKWNLGWQHGFSYKGFNLNLLFTARIGGIVISKTQAMLDRYGVSEASADARDAGGVSLGYFKVDPKTYYDAVSNLDAYYTYSATNVRLQEARLTYTFPNKWFKGTVNNLSLSVYGTNLWMIYNKAPYDPELTASTGTFGQGYDYFMLPSQSTYGLSLKFGF